MEKINSKEYLISEYVKIHNNPSLYSGDYTEFHGNKIKELIIANNCLSILDYGSGKGQQYTVDNIHIKYFNGILPTLYDPAVPNIDILPAGTFDLVVCTDVLEHIPESLLDEVLSEIYSKAKFCVYLGICNSNAQTKLSDGRDVHITKQRGPWWIKKILPHSKVKTQLYVYGQLGNCIAKIENNKLIDFPIYTNNDDLRRM